MTNCLIDIFVTLIAFARPFYAIQGQCFLVLNKENIKDCVGNGNAHYNGNIQNIHQITHGASRAGELRLLLFFVKLDQMLDWSIRTAWLTSNFFLCER